MTTESRSNCLSENGSANVTSALEMLLEEGFLKHFIAIVAEEVLTRKPDLRESLDDNLSRLGWSLSGNAVTRIARFGTMKIHTVQSPNSPRNDVNRLCVRDEPQTASTRLKRSPNGGSRQRFCAPCEAWRKRSTGRTDQRCPPVVEQRSSKEGRCSTPTAVPGFQTALPDLVREVASPQSCHPAGSAFEVCHTHCDSQKLN